MLPDHPGSALTESTWLVSRHPLEAPVSSGLRRTRKLSYQWEASLAHEVDPFALGLRIESSRISM
jgi:hypothetical protein